MIFVAQDGSPDKQFDNLVDGDEVFYMDFNLKKEVPRLPEFRGHGMEGGEAFVSSNIAILKQSLGIAKKRTHGVPEPKGEKVGWAEGPVSVLYVSITRWSRFLPSTFLTPIHCGFLCPITLVNLCSPCLPTDPPRTAMYPEEPMQWGRPNTLICLADGFYPPRISMKWKRNGVSVTEGIDTTEYYLKSDYCFQRFTYLSFVPSPGDMYSCHVEHEALENPSTVFWEPKVPEEGSGPGTVICALGLSLGIISAVVGIVLLIKERQRLQAQQQGI
ncbi:H-2 class II histocompatibility antigen, A-U alpha chain-like [Pristis pectinata]|uniref:H-2 class II histocompatibility antigen, A-U alpha chain-like n=1 Tax=Pristis pectinata TaxID=685728 RepID=UPI00223D4374|nr:H-2 class II histocompatibility antigen, A-U alpha chain-like [Pristis pectinata]